MSACLLQVTKARAVPYSYEDNVCTHSYSYVWYDADQWTAHIDWMALQGVRPIPRTQAPAAVLDGPGARCCRRRSTSSSR